MRRGVGVWVRRGSYEIFIMAWRHGSVWQCSGAIVSVVNWDLRKQPPTICPRSRGDKERQENETMWQKESNFLGID